jgi:phosphatidylserine decarboxylase
MAVVLNEDRGDGVITRYGYDIVTKVAFISLGGSLVAWFLLDWQGLKLAVVLALILLLVFTLNFFRDPERVTPSGENLVIAPADGRVVQVVTARDEEWLKSDVTQVAIFMSPLDVHVNRYPISGTVAYFRYVPGEYLVAFDDKSSLRNERTVIGLDNGKFKVLFKQIAGFVARRIIAETKEGITALAGERFGMIRFGSRVDVLLPRDAEVKVKPGDRTVAGETILAVVPEGKEREEVAV